ncbi:SCO2400 family protein [Streptomyces sp. NPDC002446]
MDYCSSCHRNLNGALVCPGCGDYAPDIAPPAYRGGSAVPTAATTTAWESWDAWQPEQTPVPGHGDGSPDATAPVDDLAPEEAGADDSGTGAGSVPVGAATGQGRAARRRQLARWKKHKRRAVAATAFAIAGGALTVALLPDKGGNGQTHATAAADPESAAKSLPTATDASEQPAERASRHPGTRPSLPTGRHRKPTADTAPAATTQQQQPDSGPTARPSTPPSAAPHTAPASADEAHTDDADAPAPKAAAPAPRGRSDAGSPPESSEPTTAPSTPEAEPAPPSDEQASPSDVCLLGVVCVG